MTNSTKDRGKWHLVGRLIRSYREDESHGGGSLSPGALVHLISVHREIEGGTYDPKDISRWEEGEGPIPERFLSDFCSALEISVSEASSMTSLAGYGAASEGQQTLRLTPLMLLRRLGGRIVPSGGYAAVGAIAFTVTPYGQQTEQILYVLGLLSLVTAMFTWHWHKSGKRDELVDELFFVSILFVLSAPLLLSAVTKMDPYNFFTIPAIGAGPLAFMLVILFNLVLSAVAWLGFVLLRQRFYRTKQTRLGAYMRAVGTAFPPTLIVFVLIFPITNPGGWIGFGGPLLIISGAFLVMLAFIERDVVTNDREKFWWTLAAIEIIVVLSAIGIAGMLVTYSDPSLTIASPEENLLIPWELDYAVLGYPESEFLERFRVGMLWTYILTIAYLVLIVGTYLVVTIRKSGAKAAKT